MHIVETEAVCKTELANATVTVATADAVDASRCHDSHNNATETSDYDSNEETTAKSMSTHSIRPISLCELQLGLWCCYY